MSTLEKILVRIDTSEQVEETFYIEEVKEYLQVVDLSENKEQRYFKWFLKNKENGDTKIILCAYEEGNP